VIGRLLAFIRFSHTVFALPFALGAMLVAAHGWPGWRIFGLILLCMVFARTAAMVFNRVVDWEMDKRNPRTVGRHKLVSFKTALALLVFSSVAFVLTTRFINPLCFALSPVALAILFFYSFTKRFTSFAHFFLGLALGSSPIGAWLAVTGHFDWPPLILAAAVLLWVAGFDLIYATQDYEFDREEKLHSLVVKLGIPRSLAAAQGLHAAMFFGLIAFGYAAHLGAIYYGSLLLVLGALVYEHQTARAQNLEAINRAFFHSNAFVGFVFVAAIALDGAVSDPGSAPHSWRHPRPVHAHHHR
jgi:4-hydroxybenzoate polyprenyltransferase